MQASNIERLKAVDTLVLAAGHGGSDSGASHDGFREADQTIVIVDQMAELLTAHGVAVEVAPHDQDTHQSIPWLNDKYPRDSTWVVEVHRDSANGLSMDDASTRCGIYHLPNRRSREVGEFVREAMKRFGANQKTWARPDTASGHGSLGWLRKTRPLAHLLELGFMQGRNDAAHLDWLAGVASAALYEALSGKVWITAPAPEVPDEVMPETADVDPNMSLLEQLAAVYKRMALVGLLDDLGATLAPDPDVFEELKEVTLAQWILESGWASSELARRHFNFAGLKWREEMKGFATPVTYQAHDGADTYCHFDNIPSFIRGYWRFLMRSPYQGWEAHADEGASFIRFLHDCGYSQSNTYESQVVGLLPRSVALLAVV